MPSLNKVSAALFAAALAASAGVAASGQEHLPRISRADALKVLNDCVHRGKCEGAAEDVAETLIRRYWAGDTALLRPLFDARLRSDAALSQTLGDFFATLLEKHPRRFLVGLAGRPAVEQRKLCAAAGTADGSGMPDEWMRERKRSLRRYAAGRGRLASAARICIAGLDEAAERARLNR
ncbi:MAG TPA: hypothetical protein VFZ44_03290 [Pyrinomonadaceae bacterium]